eukprot:jgi/Ulvmu1/704/UM010_0076.1
MEPVRGPRRGGQVAEGYCGPQLQLGSCAEQACVDDVTIVHFAKAWSLACWAPHALAHDRIRMRFAFSLRTAAMTYRAREQSANSHQVYQTETTYGIHPFDA